MKKYIKAFYKLLKGDYLARFEFLVWIAKIIFPSYRFKWPQIVWWKNNTFNLYLQRFDELNGMNTDRRWMLSQLLRLTCAVPGDTAECGVYRGASSYLICDFNRKITTYRRTHFIFDSFEGLSSPDVFDGSHWSKGDLSIPENAVEDALSEFPDKVLLKGWIPTRFNEIENKMFSFVHIDVDLYEPTLESIKFFYPRMMPGGIILCDDYGVTTCPGATKAVDDFLSSKTEKMISLCSGGGYMVKGCFTQG